MHTNLSLNIIINKYMSFFDEIKDLKPISFEAKYEYIKDVIRNEMKENPSNRIFIDEKYLGSFELKTYIADRLCKEGFCVRTPSRQTQGLPHGIYIYIVFRYEIPLQNLSKSTNLVLI